MSKFGTQLAKSSPSSTSGQSSNDTPFTHQTGIPTPDTFRLQGNHSIDYSSVIEPPCFPIANPTSCHQEETATAELRHVNIHQDPFFVASTPLERATSNKIKLSATAEVFEPLIHGHVDIRQTERAHSVTSAMSSCTDPVKKTMPADSCTLASEQFPQVNHLSETQYSPKVPVQSKWSSSRAPLVAQMKAAGLQTGMSRYIMISNLPDACCRIYLDALLSAPAILKSRLSISDHLHSRGLILLRYEDVRCAEAAFVKISMEYPLWDCNYVNSTFWAMFSHDDTYPLPSEFEGQILVSLMPLKISKQTILSELRAKELVMILSRFMMRAGHIRASSCILASVSMLVVKFEYCDIRAVDAAQLMANEWPMKDTRLTVVSYAAKAIVVEQGKRGSCISTTKDDKPSQTRFLSGATENLLSTGVSINKSTSRLVCSNSRLTESALVSHNVVDVRRIRNGQDVRTTIMLRNIPNKVDQPTLKGIIDQISYGKYDFMYLRIDFANNCNVGYAFINFEDSHSIISFAEALGGKRWNCFNSDKTAEISYATIQGKDCLVQKFRNSSVMLEAPLFRPKIFCTIGSRAGEEEDFPPPDNQSKMRRSLENAEHVGLFAPRLGQRLRDEQRRRRSRFDRGSRFSEFQEKSSIQIHQMPATFDLTRNDV